MFKFMSNGKEVRVRFYYEEIENGVCTNCVILQDGNSVGHGCTIWKNTSTKSNGKRNAFSRDFGRKLALVRAMQDAGISRTKDSNGICERTLFWDCYFARQGKSRASFTKKVVTA